MPDRCCLVGTWVRISHLAMLLTSLCSAAPFERVLFWRYQIMTMFWLNISRFMALFSLGKCLLDSSHYLPLGWVVVVQPPGCTRLFVTPQTQHARSPCSSPPPKVYPGSRTLHQWCHPAISSSDALFSFCPQSFPPSGTFPMSQLFASVYLNTDASASSSSVLPNEYSGLFSLKID